MALHLGDLVVVGMADERAPPSHKPIEPGTHSAPTGVFRPRSDARPRPGERRLTSTPPSHAGSPGIDAKEPSSQLKWVPIPCSR